MTQKNVKIKYGTLKYKEEYTIESSFLYHLKNYQIFKGNKFFKDWDINEYEFPKIITNVFGDKYNLSELEYSISLTDELYIDKASFDGTYSMSYYIDFFSKERLIVHSISSTSFYSEESIENFVDLMNKNNIFSTEDNKIVINKVFKKFSIQFI